MKKLFIALFVAAAAAVYSANWVTSNKDMIGVPVDTAVSIAAGATSSTITNTSTTGFTWYLLQAYGVCSTNATAADAVTVSKALSTAPTVFYTIDTGTIASNGTTFSIDFDSIALAQPGDLIKFTRTATSTNAAITINLINAQAK